MTKQTVLICTIAALLAACTTSSEPQVGEKYQGRSDTKKIEAATAVGYDGTAIRKNVDKSLNKNDEHGENLDKALKASSDPGQKP